MDDCHSGCKQKLLKETLLPTGFQWMAHEWLLVNSGNLYNYDWIMNTLGFKASVSTSEFCFVLVEFMKTISQHYVRRKHYMIL
jgi:hypothetical protein